MKSLARFLMPAIVAVISSTCPATEPATQPDAGADLEHIAAKGMSISDAQCRELEIQVKQHPDDAEARAELLGYYLVLEYDSPTARVARREHAMWMIRNRSTDSFTGRGFCGFDPVIDPEGYAKARELWMQQLNDAHQPLTVLSNAANFFELHDPKEAETLLRRGMAADSKNPWWPEALAHLHTLPLAQIMPADQKKRTAQALSEYELALSLTTNPAERFYLQTNLPKAALESGDLAKAKQYANQLLSAAEHFRGDWNYGNAIYTGNEVLGDAALSEGDVAAAKSYLLAAAKTPGSPVLDSFGPNMTLARDLLAKGERETVLKYFDLCSNFWEDGRDKLKSWKQLVKDGGTPDFGANLDY